MVCSAVRRVACSAVLFAVGPLAAQGVPAPAAPPLTVHSIWGSHDFASDLVEVAWTPDGSAYTTVERDAAGQGDLYRVEAVSGAKQVLVRGRDLVPRGADHPIAIEEYHFSADGAKLLINTTPPPVKQQKNKEQDFVW